MDQSEHSHWTDVIGALEADRRAPSTDPGLWRSWGPTLPDADAVERLVGLELQHGEPTCAMDLACWGMAAVADRPSLRILAAVSAGRAGLFRAARALLRPLLSSASGSAPTADPVPSAWRDLAMASGRPADLLQALVLEPSDPSALMRYADHRWTIGDHDAALATYARGLCCGSQVVKAHLRVSAPERSVGRFAARIEALRAALHPGDDVRLRARLLVLLEAADRRADALEMLKDTPDGWGNTGDAQAARRRLVAYARAQLAAAAAEEGEALPAGPRQAGEGRARQREASQRIGRALADAGWHWPAIWHLRKAAESG